MLEITNINQILPKIDGKAEFVVIDKGDYKVIDYVFQTDTTFDTPEAMECRGIKFDKQGLIIARPFRKFFNYGEQGTELPLHKPHVITTKLDGSMVHPAYVNGRMHLMTRKGRTDVAQKAERFVFGDTDADYIRCFHSFLKEGFTPIFEYVAPDNRIVLRYEFPSLVLLAARDIVTGAYLPFNRLRYMGDYWNVPIVDPVTGPAFDSPQAFVEYTRKLEGLEGFVVTFEDGTMVKVKAEDYVLKHRALDDMGSKKKVVALCCQGFADDVLAILNDADRAELIAFDHAVKAQVADAAWHVERAVTDVVVRDVTRRDAAEHVAPKMGIYRNAFFKALDGHDPRRVILQLLEKNPELVEAKWRGE